MFFIVYFNIKEIPICYAINNSKSFKTDNHNACRIQQALKLNTFCPLVLTTIPVVKTTAIPYAISDHNHNKLEFRYLHFILVTLNLKQFPAVYHIYKFCFCFPNCSTLQFL